MESKRLALIVVGGLILAAAIFFDLVKSGAITMGN